MYLTLCLTRDCNLRCGYCYAGRKFARAMEWDVARRAIDLGMVETLAQAGKTGREPKMILGFFGGEPLLEWDLLRRCDDYASQCAEQLGIHMRHTLTTNLTLVTPDKSAWLHRHKYHLGLSLDGCAAMHNTWRKYASGEKSHGDCLQGLEYVKELSGDWAEIIMVVDPRQVGYLSESVRFLGGISPYGIVVNCNFSADWSEEACSTMNREFDHMGELWLNWFREGTPRRINVIDSKIKTHLCGGYHEKDHCKMGETELTVSVNGNFYPCERLVGDDDREELCFGNVFTGFDIARRLSIIMSRGNRTDTCQSCPVKERCVNWCGCSNYASTGRLDEVSPFMCFHERLSMKVADRVGGILWEEKNPLFINLFYGNLKEG